MKKVNKSPTTRKTKSKKGTAIMKLKVIVPVILVVCAIVIGTLIMMGPKQSLQTPPIEAKAMSYMQKYNMIGQDEKVLGYKAISYYDYNKAAVITNKRIFVYDKDKVFSIPLSSITSVIIKNSDIGQQEVLITAQSHGMINFGIYHSSVAKLIELLNVSPNIVKNSVDLQQDTVPAVTTTTSTKEAI